MSDRKIEKKLLRPEGYRNERDVRRRGVPIDPTDCAPTGVNVRPKRMVLSSVLPRTVSPVLRATVVFTSIVFCANAAYLVWFNEYAPFAIVIAALFTLISVFLWRLNRYACSAAKFVIGSFIVVFISGTFNPFYALDYEAVHGLPPPWGTMLLWFIPFVLLGFLLYGILDRFKSEFK